MSTEKSLSADAYAQLEDTLLQIATDMGSIKAIIDDAAADGKFDHRLASIELIASRSGSLADLVSGRLEFIQVRGGLKEWFGDVVAIEGNKSDEVS